jgi:hypothetical protein
MGESFPVMNRLVQVNLVMYFWIKPSVFRYQVTDFDNETFSSVLHRGQEVMDEYIYFNLSFPLSLMQFFPPINNLLRNMKRKMV